MFFLRKKPAPEPRDRRGAYRDLPVEVGRMSVVLSGPELEPLAGQLADLSMHGVGVRLAGPRNANLIGGNLYQVAILSQVHPEVQTPAQLRSAIEEEGGWRYGLEFVDVGDLHGQLDDFFVRYFNRRSDRRMRLVGQERVSLAMEWDGGQRTVRVCDISAGGVGFALSPQDLPPIERGARVAVRFRLPGVTGELAGHATVAHMTLLADRFVLGLAFDFEEPNGLALRRSDLERFVDERARLREAWNALAG